MNTYFIVVKLFNVVENVLSMALITSAICPCEFVIKHSICNSLNNKGSFQSFLTLVAKFNMTLLTSLYIIQQFFFTYILISYLLTPKCYVFAIDIYTQSDELIFIILPYYIQDHLRLYIKCSITTCTRRVSEITYIQLKENRLEMESQIILNSLATRTTKFLNRIAKFSLDLICLREKNTLLFINIKAQFQARQRAHINLSLRQFYITNITKIHGCFIQRSHSSKNEHNLFYSIRNGSYGAKI